MCRVSWAWHRWDRMIRTNVCRSTLSLRGPQNGEMRCTRVTSDSVDRPNFRPVCSSCAGLQPPSTRPARRGPSSSRNKLVPRPGIPPLINRSRGPSKRVTMANPQPPMTPRGRPRATLYRCFVRLRDRLELVLERFVDGDPTAQAEFESYKADRDRRWAERDAKDKKKREKKKKKKKEKKVSAAAVAISIINGPTDEAPVWNAASPGTDDAPPGSHADEKTGPGIPKARGEGRGKGKEDASWPGGDDDDDDGVERPPGVAGGPTARRHQTDAPPPRGTQRSATLSSLVGSTLGDPRRRKRRWPDSRPGYFDPDPFPQGPSRGANATVAEVGVGDEDRLEMNIPVELGRMSWTFPIGTAR
ncbi:hypothetical protein LX36DRAFT_657206 [Colletotrichum falcatum]|nr:hypothetical protein LX36DRAFT_657206 [Colletotrichum falcatum]